jgi:hypothetical protein
MHVVIGVGRDREGKIHIWEDCLPLLAKKIYSGESYDIDAIVEDTREFIEVGQIDADDFDIDEFKSKGTDMLTEIRDMNLETFLDNYSNKTPINYGKLARSWLGKYFHFGQKDGAEYETDQSNLDDRNYETEPLLVKDLANDDIKNRLVGYTIPSSQEQNPDKDRLTASKNEIQTYKRVPNILPTHVKVKTKVKIENTKKANSIDISVKGQMVIDYEAHLRKYHVDNIRKVKNEGKASKVHNTWEETEGTGNYKNAPIPPLPIFHSKPIPLIKNNPKKKISEAIKNQIETYLNSQLMENMIIRNAIGPYLAPYRQYDIEFSLSGEGAEKVEHIHSHQPFTISYSKTEQGYIISSQAIFIDIFATPLYDLVPTLHKVTPKAVKEGRQAKDSLPYDEELSDRLNAIVGSIEEMTEDLAEVR